MIEQRILALQEASKLLEPTGDQRKEWMLQIGQYADEFIDSMESKNAFNDVYDRDNPFDDISFDKAVKLESELAFLNQEVDSVGLNPASGGHVGYIPGGGIFPTAIGDYLAAITNRYAGIYFGGPGAVRLENKLISWMCEIMGFPKTAHGNLCSGGSIANLIAITTARDKKGITSRKVDTSVVYVTSQTHHCVQKALKIAGLAEVKLRYIDMDDQYRMRTDLLENQISRDIEENLLPFLIVASAGTTDAGSIDPLDKISVIAKKHGCWFHIDAAYGGFFILVDELKDKFKGIEKADSLAIDPHKGLFLSYGLGAVLIKDVKAMYNSHFYKASYMQDAQEKYDDLSPADLSPELTKHFRGLRLWMPLRLLGIQPFKAALEEKYLLTQYFYEKIQSLGFEVGPKPDLSVALYRYHHEGIDSNDFNSMLIQEIHKDGRVFLSSTSLKGEVWIRAAILSFRTHKSTMDQCLDMIADCVQRVKDAL